MRLLNMNSEIMTVTSQSFIGRSSPVNVIPGPKWRIIAAVERNNFGYIIRRYSLSEVLSSKDIPWKFKNGKQRVFLHIFDHGFISEWRYQHFMYDIFENTKCLYKGIRFHEEDVENWVTDLTGLIGEVQLTAKSAEEMLEKIDKNFTGVMNAN